MSEPLTFDDTPTPTYEPTLAVVFYESKNLGSGQVLDEQGLAPSLAALHEITPRSSGAPLLGPATFLSRSESQTLADLFAGANRAAASPSIYPDGLLHHDASSATWFVPAARRPFHLRLDGSGLTTLSAVWPSLVLHAQQGHLFIAAAAGAARPSTDTPLFHAPLWNIWDSTEVCIGDARVPDDEPIDAITSWNSIVFDTAFSHVNHQLTLAGRKTTSKDLRTFWQRRSRCAVPPPARAMRPLRQTLSQWLVAVRSPGS